jgi:hypothetical protein
MIETRLSPAQVAQMLLKDRSLVDDGELASSNQQVSLGYSGGVFVLNWSATGIASSDFVALYRSITDPDSNFVSGAWQWATYGNSYRTSQAIISGYQARYLVWNSSLGANVSVVRTDPFPFLRICSA